MDPTLRQWYYQMTEWRAVRVRVQYRSHLHVRAMQSRSWVGSKLAVMTARSGEEATPNLPATYYGSLALRAEQRILLESLRSR